MEKTKEQLFIEKAKKVHGDKYDYSKIKYVSYTTPLEIVCPIHGSYWDKPGVHLRPVGCRECGRHTVFDKESFVKKAKKIHGDKYDYSQVVYDKAHTPVIIGCPTHGDFSKTPNNHTHTTFSQGCPKCTGKDMSKRLSMGYDAYVAKAAAVHEGRYTYPPGEYVNKDIKMPVICADHGEFKVTPRNHFKGRGCPRCFGSKGELLIDEILTKHGIEFKREYVIPKLREGLPPYRYDFYLIKENLLIEFHGPQHYSSNPMFGGKEGLESLKARDVYKKEIAKTLQYKFLEIEHTALNCSPLVFEHALLMRIDAHAAKHPKVSIPVRDNW